MKTKLVEVEYSIVKDKILKSLSGIKKLKILKIK